MTNFRLAQKAESSTIANFQISMAWETEQLKLDPAICALGVAAVFEDPHKGCYHVIEVDHKIVGSLLITYEWSDWRNGTVWWIQSVYILPEYRGQGLFSQFYKYIQTAAGAAKNVRGLRLYVDKTNKKAQQVYGKIGMDGGHYSLYEWMLK